MSDSVVIQSGEIVRFPVTSDHPLAKYQQQLDVSQLSNLQDLAVVRKLIETNPKLSTAQITTAVNGILTSSNTSTILHLGVSDLTVEEGATMVFDGPITTINAENVIVLGNILAYGSLNLSCSTLAGIAFVPPIISSISPSSGSTLGGTEVEIQGSGFDPAMEIYFGSTPATRVDAYTSGSGLCTAWAPPVANAGPVDITARTYGVLSSPTSPADVFTYVYLPGVANINVSSNVLWAGETATGTIILNEPAPSGGTTVALSTSAPTAVTVPTSVFINAGDTSATFSITASATATAGGANIYATGPDENTQSTTVEVYAGQIFLRLSPSVSDPFLPGQTATGTIFVRTPAPASGGLITLSTNHQNAVSIPATVPLPSGTTSAIFTVTALPVPEMVVVGITVSASYEGNTSTSEPFAVVRKVLQPPPPPGQKPI